VLRDVIDRACQLQDLLGSETLRQIVGAGALPPAPRVYREVSRALEDEASDARRIATIVQGDVAIVARVLQFVNSAYYGLSRKITNVEGAIAYLGMGTVKHLALAMELQRATGLPAAAVEGIERHARLTALLARKLAPAGAGDTAFAAGLLHVAGRMLLSTRAAAEHAAVVARATLSRRPICEVEREVFGATHAAVGAYLLALWALPPPIVEAVAYHADAERQAFPAVDATAAVGAACLLASAVEGTNAAACERIGAGERVEKLFRGRAAEWLQKATDAAARARE
jgi:HD-like signal output (HDOD) protein